MISSRAGRPVWVLLGSGVALIGSFAASALLARVLDPASLGVFFLIVAIVTIGSTVGRVGLDRIAIRVSADRAALLSGNREDLRIGGTLLAVAAVTVGGLTWVASSLVLDDVFREPQLAVLGPLIGLWVVVEAARIVPAEALRGQGDLLRATLTGHAGRAVLTLLALGIVVVWDFEVSDIDVLLIYIGAGVCTGVVATMILLGRSRASGPVDGGASPWTRRRMLSSGLVIMGAVLAHAALTQGDVAVLALVAPSPDVGVYGVAARVAAVLGAPLLAQNAVIAPIIARAHAEGDVRSSEATIRAWAAGTSLLVVVGFATSIFLGAPVLTFLFGDFYGRAGMILALLAGGQLLNVLTGSPGMALVMTGNERVVMRATVIVAVGALGFEYAAGRLAGAQGVAAVAAAALATQNLALLVVCRRRLGLRTEANLRSLRPRYLQSLVWESISDAGGEA